MSDTWTPGPWRFDGWDGVRRQAKILMDCNHPEGWRFGGWMGTRTEANARLIAACPTMYAYIAKKAQDGDADAARILAAL